MEAVLTVTGLKKSFGAIIILRGVDLEVFPSDVVAIIGASGSGKTTLLRCIDLLEEFEEGEIRLDGEVLGYREVSDGKRHRLAGRLLAKQRAKMAMVFQSYNLFPHLTALGNVMLGLTRVQHRSRGEAREIAESWLDRVGLADRRDHYPSALSGGQQQRVAIARALAMEPRLLLLDEVTSALDPELVQEVLLTIRGLAEAGTTMLIVTHEMRFARQVSTRTIFMDSGAIVEGGRPDEVFGASEEQPTQKLPSECRSLRACFSPRQLSSTGASGYPMHSAYFVAVLPNAVGARLRLDAPSLFFSSE